jgi:hypothetical protein
MKAFHSDPAIKERYLDRVKAHRAADELIRGEGWDGHRGCAIGCTLEAYDHSRYPIELGIPEQLAYLEDWLFERLARADAMAWPERVLSSIHVGADLSRVWPEFAIWMLTDPEHGVSQYAVDGGTRAAIAGVADLYRRTDDVSQDEWAAAREAAWVTSERAARVAAWVTSSRAARVAAWATDAVWDAAELMYAATYAWQEAPETWINVAADKLIALLEDA